MTIRNLLAVGVLALVTSVLVAAQTTSKSEKTKTTPAKSAKTAKKDAESGDLAAIRQASQKYVKAFNEGNAAAVAACWTKDGEYIDESGKVFSGREAIEQEYAEFFAAYKGAQVEVVIDSLRMLSENAALEDGHVKLEPAVPGSGRTKYTVVHVKVGGQWLMSSVRDSAISAPAAASPLADLEWLIGTWVSEESGFETESVCRWVANKSFVERSYTTQHPDKTTTSGIQLIGYNARGDYLQSWNFSSDGGFAVGVWYPQKNGWSAEIEGTTGGGVLTTAVNILTRLDDNAYSWQSVARSAAGFALPDTDEVIVKRSSPARSASSK